MSAKATAWAWGVISGGAIENKNSAKLVLLRLADRADPEGRCWPGHQRTARDLQMSRSVVKEAIKFLQRKGLIRAIHRKCEEGDANTNLYYLCCNDEEGGTDPGEGVGRPQAHPDESPGGPEVDPPVGRPQAHGGPEAGPESKTESQTRSSSTPARARAPAAAAAEPVGKGKESKEFSIIEGIQCWSTNDAQAALALVEQHGREAILDAVAAVQAMPASPLPGRVASELQRRAAAAQAGSRAAAAAARIARIEADSLRRAELELANPGGDA